MNNIIEMKESARQKKMEEEYQRWKKLPPGLSQAVQCGAITIDDAERAAPYLKEELYRIIRGVRVMQHGNDQPNDDPPEHIRKLRAQWSAIENDRYRERQERAWEIEADDLRAKIMGAGKEPVA